jgi:hypothetical protein
MRDQWVTGGLYDGALRIQSQYRERHTEMQQNWDEEEMSVSLEPKGCDGYRVRVHAEA